MDVGAIIIVGIAISLAFLLWLWLASLKTAELENCKAEALKRSEEWHEREWRLLQSLSKHEQRAKMLEHAIRALKDKNREQEEHLDLLEDERDQLRVELEGMERMRDKFVDMENDKYLEVQRLTYWLKPLMEGYQAALTEIDALKTERNKINSTLNLRVRKDKEVRMRLARVLNYIEHEGVSR